MATYNMPNTGTAQIPVRQQPTQIPYGNNSVLLNNAPYDNYMGNRMNNTMMQPAQIPYGNNSVLLNNTPYDNYMGNRMNDTMMQPASMNQFLKCRPVSSGEEARAYQIDLDGSLWVFTDIGNDKIYTKQVNNDGTATFKTYSFVEDEQPYSSPTGDFITRDEFNRTIQTLMVAMQSGNLQKSDSVPTLNNNENKEATLAQF